MLFPIRYLIKLNFVSTKNKKKKNLIEHQYGTENKMNVLRLNFQ